MAEYLTNSTDLTKVANAIRAKVGTTEQLIYPDGFVTAISNIPTGGTPSEPPAAAEQGKIAAGNTQIPLDFLRALRYDDNRNHYYI